MWPTSAPGSASSLHYFLEARSQRKPAATLQGRGEHPVSPDTWLSRGPPDLQTPACHTGQRVCACTLHRLCRGRGSGSNAKGVWSDIEKQLLTHWACSSLPGSRAHTDTLYMAAEDVGVAFVTLTIVRVDGNGHEVVQNIPHS